MIIPLPDPVADFRSDVVTPRLLHFSAAQVGFGDRIYRTWMLGASPEVHTMMALTALADADPAQAETCRVA